MIKFLGLQFAGDNLSFSIVWEAEPLHPPLVDFGPTDKSSGFCLRSRRKAGEESRGDEPAQGSHFNF